MTESRKLALVEEETDILLLRYLDLEFVDDVTDYKCGRCERVLIKHYISNCKHHFCLNCKKILEDGDSNHKWRCPVCQQFIDHMDHQNVKLAEQVKALRVRCPNCKYGCPFISSIEAMTDHLKECRDTKEAALPAIYEGTNTMQAVLDEIGKINKKIGALNEGMNVIGQINKKIDMLNEGISVVSDMIIHLDKVDNENRKHVELEIDDLKRKVIGVESDLHTTSIRMQNDIKTIQVPTSEDKTSQITDEMKILQTGLEITKAEVNDNTKFIIDMFDQKEEKLNQKLNQAQTEMENVIATEKAWRMNESNGQNAELNSIAGRLNKVAEQMTTHKDIQNAVDQQFKADINQIKAELEKNKNKQEVQLATINHCNELISQLTLNENEINGKIKQSQHKLSELEEKWQRMEDYTPFKEIIDLHKAQKVVFNQEILESQSLVYSWTIKDIKENMKKKRFQCESDMFPLKDYDFGAKIKFKIHETGYAKMSLCFVNDHNTGQIVHFKVQPEVTYIIKDQIDDIKGIITTIDMDYSKSFKYGKYCNKSMCSTTIMHSPYLINDTMVIDIYVEPLSIAQQMHPTNGVIIYYINNYTMNKAFEKEVIVYSQPSPYFYTSLNGYRVKVWIYLNGADDFKGKGLTAYIKFLDGESLPETFKHKTTITIFNQCDTNKHLIKCSEQINYTTYYNIDIALHSEIENGGFLLNDTLIYRVDIQEI